jgi:DMSO/TMAO reductase YedYZ molybdopterin-dependent catalytic subunit
MPSIFRLPQAAAPLACALLLAACAASPNPGSQPPATSHHARAGTPTTQFQVGGAVAHPAIYDLSALRALPATQVAAGGHQYAGVSLWSLLDAAGLAVNPGERNGRLAGYVLATGSDGYRVVFSLGELAPDFGNQPVIVAYTMDGQPLDTSGFARLVVPGDKKGGRSVANLAGLEIIAAPPAR